MPATFSAVAPPPAGAACLLLGTQVQVCGAQRVRVQVHEAPGGAPLPHARHERQALGLRAHTAQEHGEPWQSKQLFIGALLLACLQCQGGNAQHASPQLVRQGPLTLDLAWPGTRQAMWPPVCWLPGCQSASHPALANPFLTVAGLIGSHPSPPLPICEPAWPSLPPAPPCRRSTST